MFRLFVERLMNIRCCCEQDAAAYRTVLYPNNYSKAPVLQLAENALNWHVVG